MLRALIYAMVLASFACNDAAPTPTATSSSSGSAEPPPTTSPPASPEPPPPDDGTAEVARMVVRDVGSKALGNQTIDPACVSVTLVPTGDWTIAAARLSDCGDKNARSIVWLYKRRDNGKWNEDYVGQPPKCWKGVPPDIAPAVAIATKIKAC